MNLSLVFQAS